MKKSGVLKFALLRFPKPNSATNTKIMRAIDRGRGEQVRYLLNEIRWITREKIEGQLYAPQLR